MFDQDLLLEFFEGKDKDAGTYSTWFQGLFLKISVFEFEHGLEIIRSPPRAGTAMEVLLYENSTERQNSREKTMTKS